MDTLITNQAELRHRGFKALTEALGWVNAVRFLRQYDPGSGNYTEERRTLLPDWDAATLVQEARKLQEPRKPGT
jgi:predicted nucleic acid-binding Zn ribbon protein